MTCGCEYCPCDRVLQGDEIDEEVCSNCYSECYSEPPEPPEFPSYVGWDGREHAEF